MYGVDFFCSEGLIVDFGVFWLVGVSGFGLIDLVDLEDVEGWVGYDDFYLEFGVE